MDLVAAEDATIASIVTRSGLAAVKAGDEVKAGDILVSGRQEILDDDGEVSEYYYRSADADVMGYAAREYEDWIEETQINSEQTGKSHSGFSVTAFGYKFTSPKLYAEFESSEIIEETIQLCLPGSIYLPFYYSRILESEITETSETLSTEAAKELALSHLEQFLSDLEENGVRIIDKNVMIEKIGKKYHIYGQVEVCENIARQTQTEVIDLTDKGLDQEGNQR
jgi:similar to stage IV sporulation protein